MTTTLYLIRHAQSHPSSDQHYTEWPLSDHGKRQAAELAPLLGGLGIERLYTSPYIRCVETIRPFVAQTRLEPAVEHHLGERVISKTLLPSFEEVWNRSWEDFDFALPECETSAAAQRRFCGALQRIATAHEGSVLGISSHGNVIALFLNFIDRNFSRDHADTIRNPDVFKVRVGKDGWSWDRRFELPGLDRISTHHAETPIRFSQMAID